MQYTIKQISEKCNEEEQDLEAVEFRQAFSGHVILDRNQ